ncbi:unnamed protein product (macronuclear) [Paramecium tetraurelia]|uniref:EF-hand domain-containing protein n=1 Tax=Paramecium tetraurelia TaxID=5888 RepID=A0CET4_PARTE|nr:uncharacterized protein GSPATT00037740001 [Paramecium tetraurelia]CAK69301.1 unnamed protein product [Paramecium tetraurelia]|eukprot:XP_001436698.1 hypothetical protein (macronuclear) [Paramecium tetraurelia strain d4-2]
MKDHTISLKSLNNRTMTSMRTRTRDISHLTDSLNSARVQEQIKQKQLVAELHLQQYVQQQRTKKQNQAYLSNQLRVKTEEKSDQTSEQVNENEILPILEQISELNFEEITSGLSQERDRSHILTSLKQSLFKAINSTPTLVSLKQQSNSFFSAQPTGRRDAIMLKQWFVNFMEATQQSQKDFKDKLISLSEALHLCLLEVIRQVSYQCAERGQLLHSLVKGYILVFHKHFMIKEEEKRRLKFQLFEKNINEAKQKEELENRSQLQISQLTQELNQLKQKENLINSERISYQQTINKLQNKINLQQTIQKSAANMIGNLQREIDQLKHQLSKKNQNKHSSMNKSDDVIEEQDLSLSQVLKELNQQNKFEQNQDVIVKDVIEILPVVCHSVGVQTFQKCLCVIETQTDLQLMSPQYDKFLSTSEIENTFREFELKQQLDQQSWLDGLCDQMNMHLDEPSIQDYDTRGITKIDLIYEVPENDEGSPDVLSRRKNDYMQDRRLQIDRSETSEKLIRELDKYGSDRLLNIKQVQQGTGSNNTQQNSQQSSQKVIKLSPQAGSLVNQTSACKIDSIKQNQKQQVPQQQQVQISSQRYFPSNDNLEKKNINIQEKQVQKKKKMSVSSQYQQQQQQQTQQQHVQSQQQQSQSSYAIQYADSTEKAETFQQPNLSKSQTTMLMLLYQIQKQKAQNATTRMNETNELLTQILLFARKLTVHILKSQFKTHTQIAEEFLFEFESLRKKIQNDKEILEEEYVLDEEKEKEEKKQEAMKRRKGKIQRALRLNFATRQMKQIPTIDRLTHPGVLLAIKAREQSHLFKKVVAYWPVKNVLRTISQIYLEKASFGGEADMQIFVFNFFLNKYGFKHVAEKKYLQFLLSVIHFCQIFRVNLFARLLCLLHDEHLNFTQEESAFLLSGLEYIHSQTSLGVNIVQGDSESKFHVPYLRALDYIKMHLENKLTEDEVKELRQDLDNLRESDAKNKAGVVDIDLFMSKVLDKYRNVTHRTKVFVIHAFQAADLDGNKKINHNEFLTLFRHIEGEKFDFQEALDLFDEQADIIHQGEKNLSFNRFTSVCVNQQIFTENSLNDFIGKEANMEQIFDDVVKTWNQYKLEIQGLLTQLQPFVTQEIYQEWVNILFTLEKRILHQKTDYQNVRPILIAHKILKLELTRLLDEDEQNQNKE